MLLSKISYLAVFALLIGCVEPSRRKIDNNLLRALRFRRQDVLVNFVGGNSRVIESIQSKSFQTRLSKTIALTSGLQLLADSTQAPIQQYLSSQNVQYRSFWSSNQMVVRSATFSVVLGIAAFPEVSRIQKMPVVRLSPIPSRVVPSAATIQWGVAKIQADQVWSQFGTMGEGVVVANIDTGVRGTHEALSGNWRQDHGWYDPYTNVTLPDDQNGHGSHTMGTIAGANGIGVAPGAKWIACRGCNSQNCASEQLLACGQWMLSPTNPDGTDPQPSMIPDVVSNSWGSPVGGDPWYNSTIDAWKAAGILSAFAIGNQGPACFSGGSPGDQPTVFSVGSTDINDRLSRFSSKGTAGGTYYKPEIVAPGSDVYSAWYTSDTAYNTISGTSMATPHVAGAIALMVSAYRNKQANTTAKLTQDQVATTIEKTAVTQGLTLGLFNFPCDNRYNRQFPNNQFGYGRLNALSAVNATINGS